MLHKHLNQLLVEFFCFDSQVVRHLSSSDLVAVFPLELFGLADDGVGDQPVQTLQERGAEVLMQKVDVPEAEDLSTLVVVPAAHAVEVVSSAQAV